MSSRDQQVLINEIESFSKSVSTDAKSTILTIRNLIESNARVENSIEQLHKSINNSSLQNEKLQKRIYFLTIVAVILTLVQATAVVIEFYNQFSN